jgi:polyisoprenoid-binding protein YceI
MKITQIFSPVIVVLLTTFTLSPSQVYAENYLIDTKGAHAFIQFRIQHLGYSWLTGRFNTFSGTFNYDENNPGASSVQIEIDTASVDSNHAERDKHLRGKDFLHVDKFPKAKFVSTAFKPKGNNAAILEGNLTLHGITQPITIAVEHIGHGPDPWGGYRRGFEGNTKISLADFGINYNLGPKSKDVMVTLSIEGIRQKE